MMWLRDQGGCSACLNHTDFKIVFDMEALSSQPRE